MLIQLGSCCMLTTVRTNLTDLTLRHWLNLCKAPIIINTFILRGTTYEAHTLNLDTRRVYAEVELCHEFMKTSSVPCVERQLCAIPGTVVQTILCALSLGMFHSLFGFLCMIVVFLYYTVDTYIYTQLCACKCACVCVFTYLNLQQ